MMFTSTHKAKMAEVEKERDKYRVKYLKEAQDYLSLAYRYRDLIDEYRELEAQANTSPFNKEDLNRLIRLCHPDKHNGRTVATDMTKMLLGMRENL